MPKDYTVVRKAAVELAGSGEATLAEIARLAGTSRQLVRFWLRDIDVPNRRQAHLQKLWREHLKAQRSRQ